MVLLKTEGNTTTQSTAVDKNMFTTPCDDDYNPAEPNNYADYCEQRRSRENMKRREEEHRRYTTTTTATAAPPFKSVEDAAEA